MKSVLLWIGGVILGIALLIGISFGGKALGLWQYSFFAPKFENVRREVFENTQSYVEGKRQSLTKHYNEWRKEDSQGKEAIRMIVLQEFANFDTSLFTPTQLAWYSQITN